MSLGFKLYQLILKSRSYWKLWQRKHYKFPHPTVHFGVQFMTFSLPLKSFRLLIYLPTFALDYVVWYCIAQNYRTNAAILINVCTVEYFKVRFLGLNSFGSLKWPINGAAYSSTCNSYNTAGPKKNVYTLISIKAVLMYTCVSTLYTLLYILMP